MLVDAHLPHDLTPLYIAHALHHSTWIKDSPATLNSPSLTCTVVFHTLSTRYAACLCLSFPACTVIHDTARHPFHALAHPLGALGSFRSYLHPASSPLLNPSMAL